VNRYIKEFYIGQIRKSYPWIEPDQNFLVIDNKEDNQAFFKVHGNDVQIFFNEHEQKIKSIIKDYFETSQRTGKPALVVGVQQNGRNYEESRSEYVKIVRGCGQKTILL
jgi:hypothetical protein